MMSSGEQGAGMSDPQLQQVTDKADAIERLFDCLTPALRLEALDVLQNLVNHVMSKMTHGSVRSVRFVPVPAEAESNNAESPPEDHARVQTDIDVKQEPTDEGWSHETINGHRIGVLQEVSLSESPETESSSTHDSNMVEAPLMSSTPKSKSHIKYKQSPSATSALGENSKSAKRSLPKLTETHDNKSKKPAKKLAGDSNEAKKNDKTDAMDDSGIGEGVLDLSSTAMEEYEEFAESETSQDLREEFSSTGSPESKDDSDMKYSTKPDSVNTVLNWSRTPPRKRKKKDTSKLPFHCEHCNFATNRKYSLDTHMSLHTGDSKYKCTDCDKCFTAASSLKRHMMIHDGVRPFKCPVCQKKFVDIAGLRTHSAVHTGERLFKCELCTKAYTNHANLARHKRVHTGEMPYICKYDGCDAKFRDLSSLKLHVLKHTGEKPYNCPFCQKKFKTSSDFRRHERTHTQERNYKCTECGKTFIQGYHLKQHLKIHADLWLFSCNLCNKRFRTKASLQHHMKGHAGVKDYNCEKCGSAFTTKRYLNDHYIAAHTNAKPYKCDVCHKGFNHISNMKRHKRMHSDEFRYKCRFCGRGFKYINSLQYHEGIHTGEKKICEKCGFTCRSIATIKAHRCGKKSVTVKNTQKVRDQGGNIIESDVHNKAEQPDEKTNCSPALNVSTSTATKCVDDDELKNDNTGNKPLTASTKSAFVNTPRKSKQRAIKMIESITEELNDECKPPISKLRIRLSNPSTSPKVTVKSRKRGRPRQLKSSSVVEERSALADEDSKDRIELKIENSFSLTSENPEVSAQLTEHMPLASSDRDKERLQNVDIHQEKQLQTNKPDGTGDLNSAVEKAGDDSFRTETVERSIDTLHHENKESNSNIRSSVKDSSLMEDITIMQEAYGTLSATNASNGTVNGEIIYTTNDVPKGVLGSGFEDLERCMPVIAQVYSVRE